MSLTIGALAFPDMDQCDLTGPFEVLSRLPDADFRIVSHDGKPVRDIKGFLLTPDVSFAEAPQFDLLVVTGGAGANRLLEDEPTLEFVRRQAAQARLVLSVCTGALICGAAGLLRGKRATTHWASFQFLPLLGAIPVDSRVVVDGNLICAAGVTSGIDGALVAAGVLCGEKTTCEIQLYMQYEPQPPFDSGSPGKASSDVLAAQQEKNREITRERETLLRRVAARLGVDA